VKRAFLFALMLMTASEATAGIKVLTPTNDSCGAFTTAIDTANETQIAVLGGWTIGFLSGAAQGTGIDFLRNEDTALITKLLYDDCSRQPDKLLSLAAEELARSLATQHR
jgi:hypothetical protein